MTVRIFRMERIPLRSAFAESREAAKEYSPRRPPWETDQATTAPAGRKTGLLNAARDRNGNDSRLRPSLTPPPPAAPPSPPSIAHPALSAPGRPHHRVRHYRDSPTHNESPASSAAPPSQRLPTPRALRITRSLDKSNPPVLS